MAMLVAEGVEKSFGGVHAVNGCSFSVEEGSITALIGPNGAGKSTMFAMIAGFLAPDRGSIRFRDREIGGLRVHEVARQGIARTFQIPHEFSGMTARENLLVVPAGQAGENLLTTLFRYGRVRREEKRLRHRADEVLEFLGLTHVADELASQLSGGQKKLLELGKAMMTGARLILLDEPGAGVNPTLLRKLAEDIRRLNEEQGITFCIIEHDLDLVGRLCNPVLVLAEGRLLAKGTMAEVTADPEVKEAYLGEAPVPSHE
jgi:branched-chain amino acid transport system ATP-binding protein